jgi:hypothetical protein
VLAGGCEGCKRGVVNPMFLLCAFFPFEVRSVDHSVDQNVSLAPTVYANSVRKSRGNVTVQMPPVGLEPTTLKLRGLNSIQLNYGGTFSHSITNGRPRNEKPVGNPMAAVDRT